jgi:YHS domain-containing protein
VAAAALVTAAAMTAGCSALQAQNPASALSPVNAVPEGDARLMLAGHDVVAYFTQGRHALGQPQYSSVYEGVTFRFASAQHKALFDAAPTRYLPQYGGYCANGIVYGIPWGGDADRWRIEGGKLYIFGGELSKAAFELDVPGNIRLADRYWVQEVAGSNSFIQRSWRLTWRVPHYKSTEELQQMVAAAQARQGATTGR